MLCLPQAYTLEEMNSQHYCYITLMVLFLKEAILRIYFLDSVFFSVIRWGWKNSYT